MVGIVQCKNVGFRYGEIVALSGVSFDLTCGVTGLLGVNGAGKSTLMRLLATLCKPSSGSIRISGKDVSKTSERTEARHHLGYLPQAFDVMGFSTLLANVEYAAWSHGVSESDVHRVAVEALKTVDLSDLRNRRARTLSGGQRQRLGIACATAHRPDLLLLDEPTVGVDPLQRAALRDLIGRLGHSSTVLVSTHLVEDIARLADHVLIVDQGRLAFDGTADDLASMSPDQTDRAAAIDRAFQQVVSG
ncbi:ABC-2 type transport system ATP-binding protein [Bifidobacterium commune]|uniref:ABC-2 type transport system ATP-binding protein n=1 Tax=Bifidobacterium commune TaxID=1505727 RepID=A0A1C4GZD4_9BIFI|nr:ATP-binding cassette domain-containing protein [Bifidobacterium commune]MBB2955276.1 ABC-2 type transport system ATP-binding protein [Bifidobacterium commune]SCC78024.1 ABC-2 type transport system ATP-binding protein [Bifidobacterium commune]